MNESFTARVYEIVAQIPAGKVATYGDVAAMAGNAKAARAVRTRVSSPVTEWWARTEQ